MHRWFAGVIERSSGELELPGLLIELSKQEFASRSEAEYRELVQRANAFPESDASVIAQAESRRREYGPDETKLCYVWCDAGRRRVYSRFQFPDGPEMESDAVLLENKMWTAGGDRVSIRPFVDPPYSGQDPRQQYAYRVRSLRFLLSWGLLRGQSITIDSFVIREGNAPNRWIADVEYSNPPGETARVFILRDQGRFAIDRIDRPALGDRAASRIVLGDPVSIGESSVVVPSSVETYSASGRKVLAVRLIRAEVLDRRAMEQVFTEPTLGAWHDPIRQRDVQVSLLVDYRRDPPRVIAEDSDRAQRLVLQGHGSGGSSVGRNYAPVLVGVVLVGGLAALAGCLIARNLRR
ncbi:MAG: hypothetical protein EA423_09750 [Phycisphaerales bacterium]|nr:MAG: hypothetical protein EA423_09750 [Phycisphaerales bacterium]